MSIRQSRFANVFLFAATLTLCSCGGGQINTSSRDETPPGTTGKSQAATVDSAKQVKPLDTKFNNVVVKKLTAPDIIKQDYPEALGEIETSVISHLKSKNDFAKVKSDTGGAQPEKTLAVGIRITDMRITSFGARFWGGPLAGNSFMNLDLELVDSASGKVLRTEPISSTNNSWGASWSFGASDRSLPTDMGQIVAEYIYEANGGKKQN